MWQSGIKFEFAIDAPNAAELSETFVRWLVPRAPHCHSLGIAGHLSLSALNATTNPHMVLRQQLQQPPSGDAHTVASNITAALATVGPYIKELSFEWGASLLVLSGWVATMTSLRVASFACRELVVRPGLGSLSRLTDLRLKSSAGPLVFAGATSLLLPPQLKALRMDGCHLRQLPEAVASLRHLTDLVLSNNAFTPEALTSLAAMTTLQQLTLMGTRMTRLPSSLSTLTSLKVLYLDGVTNVAPTHHDVVNNNVMNDVDVQISESLNALRSLGILSLGSSRLTRFPQNLIFFTSLRVLYLDNNLFLTELPDGPYLRRLVVLGIDWKLLFHSHHVLAGAPLLTKLCVTSLGGVEDMAAEDRDEDAVAESLLAHPRLQNVLLPLVDGNRIPLHISVLNVALRLAASSRIQVRAVTYGGISNEWIEYLLDLEKSGDGADDENDDEKIGVVSTEGSRLSEWLID